MNLNKQFIRLFLPVARTITSIFIGTLLLFYIIRFIFSGLEYLYLLLLIPVALVILFGMVAIFLSEFFRLMEAKEYTVGNYKYTHRDLISLYLKSFFIVTCGLSMALIFGFFRDLHAEIPDLLFYSLDIILTGYAIGSIIKSAKMRELNMRRIQSENALLKSQLNPHFLYNTLNNIDALIAFDTEKASEAVLTLSSLLRYMTYQGNRQMVSLQEEIRHITDFVSLQRLRFENPNVIRFNINIGESAIQIAPMLLIPFIENIFKHASDRDTDDAIVIEISVPDKKHISFHTLNKRSENSPKLEKESGMGLKGIQRRLKLLYPNRHELSISEQGEYFEVTLVLEIE